MAVTSGLYSEALADFLVDRHALAGFDSDCQPVPDRLVECAALLSTEHAALHVPVIDERHRSCRRAKGVDGGRKLGGRLWSDEHDVITDGERRLVALSQAQNLRSR